MKIHISCSGVERHATALSSQRGRAAALRECLDEAARLARAEPLADVRALERCAAQAARLEKSVERKIGFLNDMAASTRRAKAHAEDILAEGDRVIHG